MAEVDRLRYHLAGNKDAKNYGHQKDTLLINCTFSGEQDCLKRSETASHMSVPRHKEEWGEPRMLRKMKGLICSVKQVYTAEFGNCYTINPHGEFVSARPGPRNGARNLAAGQGKKAG